MTNENSFDFPWKSMIPQIKKLIDLDLVIQADGVYSVSEMGTVIATNMQFLLNTLQIYDENRDFWSEPDLSSIPFNLLTRIGELGLCRVLKPNLSHIFKVQEDIIKCMMASSRIMVLVSAVHPAYHLACLEFIERRSTSQLSLQNRFLRASRLNVSLNQTLFSVTSRFSSWTFRSIKKKFSFFWTVKTHISLCPAGRKNQ